MERSVSANGGVADRYAALCSAISGCASSRFLQIDARLPIRREFKPKRGGLLGAFLLGLFFGVVSSPCATPVLVVILTFVVTKGEILYGVALLFVYALGHCLLMLAAGTFTGFIEAFVKAKGVVSFSAWAKRISGGVVTLVGAWFIWQGF